MKNYLFLFLCLLTQNLFSQENVDKKALKKEYFTTAEIDVKPEFPGGGEKMYSFIAKNYKIPESKEKIIGKIYIVFIVETDGSILDVKITKDIGHGTGEEAIRVIKMFPKWKPGEKNGEKVRVQYQIPISIN
ncbi:hypothetical protein EOD40_12390 [Flavobacterium sufflavum]|uniref:TonB C-terminal domain-containing protein n=1 Tax=Flavobacterium sufflavum TaxID=1921138 RepID=A0A3S2U1B3_9FLAO|nr:energy transducer TonB [Flavobacterium sufflavum]RVT74965.1 hypothetical protein EOD40_12390 [Flavobacterium sufflavum]